MKTYCQIVNGAPRGPSYLPSEFKNVSNFHALDDATLATYSWYPCIQQNENMTGKIKTWQLLNGIVYIEYDNTDAPAVLEVPVAPEPAPSAISLAETEHVETMPPVNIVVS